MATKLQQSKVTLTTTDNYTTSSEATMTPPAGLTTVKASTMTPLGAARPTGATPTTTAQDWLLTILWSD